MEYPVIRNLDGIYFRVCRDGKWENICFTDLTNRERAEVMKGRSAEWYCSLAYELCNVIRKIGDELDLEMVDRD